MDPLLAARAEALTRLGDLQAARVALMAAVEGSNVDDEHDPEGATIAFEREQLAALIGQAQRSVEAASAALAARAVGTYGTCTVCGVAIGAERLAARPTASTCITCA